MNTFSQKCSVVTILTLAMLLAFAGCQAAATPTIAPIPTIAPTPTESVVVEREANCPIENFIEQPSIKVMDTELGEVDRAFYVRWSFSCEDPYIKGQYFAIQDGYTRPDGTYVWTSMLEIVTDEGGVWKGNCDNDPKSSRCTFIGDSKYKGLKMTSEYFGETGVVKFRIAKIVME